MHAYHYTFLKVEGSQVCEKLRGIESYLEMGGQLLHRWTTSLTN